MLKSGIKKPLWRIFFRLLYFAGQYGRGDHEKGGYSSAGIGGGQKGDGGTMNLDGVSLKVSSNNLNWTDYDVSNRME